jgi:hypothetical protein
MADEQEHQDNPNEENGAIRNPVRTPPQNLQQPAQEEPPQNSSRFAGADQSIQLLRRHLGNEGLEAHLEEMIRTGGRVRKDKDGVVIDLPGGSHIHSHVKDGHAVIEPENGKVDAQSAKTMISLAKSHGWKDIEVTGKPEEKALLWLEAQRQGLEVKNYEPPAALKQQWEKERAALPQPGVSPVGDAPQAAAIEEIDDTVYRQTIKTLQDRTNAEQNPAVRDVLQAIADRFTDAVAQGDKRSYSIMAQGLSDRDQLAGVNKVIDFLNGQDATLGLNHIQDGSPATPVTTRTGPKAAVPA